MLNIFAVKINVCSTTMSEKDSDAKYIAALDIGTTSVRCFVYDAKAQICGVASENVCELVAINRIYSKRYQFWRFFFPKKL